MAPRNDPVPITVREWEALVRSVERVSDAVEKLEREVLVFKAKAGVWMFIIGSVGGIGMSIATHFVMKLLP